MSAGPRTSGGIAFVGVLALGIAIRAVDFLNCRSLGLDEARLAINVASRPLLGLLEPLDLDQSAPPLFLWGERLAFQLLGHSDCGLRLLPALAGSVAALLIYPLAVRFVDDAEARLAGLLGVSCPLLITYSNAVKQYSVELLVAVLLVLFFERSSRRSAELSGAISPLAVGALAPWISLSSVFVLATAWLVAAYQAARYRSGAARLAVLSLVWGVSGAVAYAVVYRAAGQNPYMRRFWELAFVTPTKARFAGHTWKTVEDQVWGFVAGDPLIDRRPHLWLLHIGSVLVVGACVLGLRRIMRKRGGIDAWWLCGPAVLTLAASMLGVFPIAPRLTLFLLPGLIVLFVAGVSDLVRKGREAVAGHRLEIVTAVLVLPLAWMGIVRTFELETPRHFQRLVLELRERRTHAEPVYIFARSLPAWIFYSTDWARPDTTRLRLLTAAAGSSGGAFENARSRGTVREAEAAAVDLSPAAQGELLGLPSGMEWREVEEHVRSEPDSGWVELERRRIETSATPGVWVLATAFYEPETKLFEALERDASRRTFAHLRPGSALVRYEFERADSSSGSEASAGARPRSSTALGRRSTATTAGR